MTDRYLELANANLTKTIFDGLGLPTPVRLKREDHSSAHKLSGHVLVGCTEDGSFAKVISPCWRLPDDIAEPDNQAKVSLVFDASGISTTEQSSQLYQFFSQHLSSLALCGRVIVIGHKPQALTDTTHATLQRGLVGFIKSVAKEIGRKGATANLLYIDKGGKTAIEAPLRFLLSAGSAFMNAQVINVGKPVVKVTGDWARPLEGKSVVVTGAARGIGLAISQVLARDGATVIGIDVPQAADDLNGAMAAINGLSLPLDITTEDAADLLVQFCLDHNSQLHSIIHNAGITRDKMLSRMTSVQWDLLMQVNLGAAQRINDALLGDRFT